MIHGPVQGQGCVGRRYLRNCRCLRVELGGTLRKFRNDEDIGRVDSSGMGSAKVGDDHQAS